MDDGDHWYEQNGRDQRCATPERARIAAVRHREAVDGDHRAEWKVDRIGQADQYDARDSRGHIDGQRGEPPGHQRQRAGRHQQDPQAVKSAGARVRDAEPAGGQHAQ